MKEPHGEQVELGFYFGSTARRDAFERVIKYCCENGGIFDGTVLQSEETGPRSNRFTHIYDRGVRELTIAVNELEKRLEDKDGDIVKVAIWSAIGTSTDVPEVVTYGGVSADASQVDNPTIAVVGEGWVFSTPGYERQAKKVGRRCQKKLMEICSALDPDYAAILNEDSLPCRYDLARGAGKRCFANFFISERAYQQSMLTAIEALYRDAYTERTSTGIYVSTWSMYNPKNITIANNVAIERSVRVAQALGSEGRRDILGGSGDP